MVTKRQDLELLLKFNHNLDGLIHNIFFALEIIEAKSQHDKNMKCLDIISSNIYLLNKLTQSMLNYLTLKTRGKNLLMEKTELNGFIDMVIQLFSRKYKSKIKIEYTKPAQQIYRLIDKQLFSIALFELLDNAAKFSEKNIIHVTLAIENRKIQLAIKNQGKTIPAEYYKKIFLLFFKIPSAIVGGAVEKGVGLGLTTCKKIIDLHKGKIELKSESGIGTTFIILL